MDRRTDGRRKPRRDISSAGFQPVELKISDQSHNIVVQMKTKKGKV